MSHYKYYILGYASVGQAKILLSKLPTEAKFILKLQYQFE